MEVLEKYFYIKPEQKEKFIQFYDLFKEWNAKINLISRKDFDFFWINHVLHSLAIAKFVDLDGCTIIDVGTGGGLPGIPLAIMFPQAEFTMIDSINKKMKAVEDMISKLQLTNAKSICIRSNEYKAKYDFVVARAVTDFSKFYYEVKHLMQIGHKTNRKNGIIYLKGGNLFEEIALFKNKISLESISTYFEEEFFKTKMIVHYKI